MQQGLVTEDWRYRLEWRYLDGEITEADFLYEF